MEIHIEQNTPAWLCERCGPCKVRIGGSEVGVACGVPGASALPQALYAKIRGVLAGTWLVDDAPTPAPCAHGHWCEAAIAALYERLTGSHVVDGNYWRHADPDLAVLYGCSPDRKVLAEDGSGADVGLLEIKAPYYRAYTAPKPEHVAQVQYQMWLTGSAWCDYLAALVPHADPVASASEPPRCADDTPYLLRRIRYSAEYVDEWMRPRLRYFSACLLRDTEPLRAAYATGGRFADAPPPVTMDDVPLRCVG